MTRTQIAVVVLLGVLFALAVGGNRRGPIYKVAYLKQKVSKKTCNVNVCFALDGSLSVPPDTYKDQKEVTRKVVAGISTEGSDVGLAAVQYGIINKYISPFTTNKKKFLSALQASVQTKENGTFTTAGLNYCFSELFNRTGSNKIVLFGTGESTIGSDPAERAGLFFQTGGEVYAVGVGLSQNINALTAIAGGDANRVFSIKETTSTTEVATRIQKVLC